MSEVIAAQVTDVAAPAAPLADCPPEQLAQARYFTAIQALVQDAVENEQMEPLIDVLTRTLARVGLVCGGAAIGDIVMRIGGNICEFARRDAAEREAKEAARAGRRPH